MTAAELLMAAHDHMLINGKVEGVLEDLDGSVCMHGAMNRAEGVGWNSYSDVRRSAEAELVRLIVELRLCDSGYASIVKFSDSHSLDDVLEVFRLAAKRASE